MSIDNAKALVAKLRTDSSLLQEFKAAKSEQDFLETTKKMGYNVTLDEFRQAAKESAPEGGQLSEKELEQVAGGLSIVGVDFAFTVIQVA